MAAQSFLDREFLTDRFDLLPPNGLLARSDLAEQALEGVVGADRYAATTPLTCGARAVDIRDRPEGQVVDQLVFGELFDVLERHGALAWGRARRSGVVGWAEVEALAAPAEAPTHRVAAARADVFAGPSGGALAATLPMNALVRDARRRNGLVEVAGLGWIASADLADFSVFERDLAASAERFAGAPFRLGGRTVEGTDCSGMVQQALYAAGLAGPRFAGDQAGLGVSVEMSEARRGDLIVWRSDAVSPWGGHAAILLDAQTVIHASSAAGAVLAEAVAEVDARYRANGFEAPVVRRLS
ncbi:NlpC/P60 family protein [uncultured Brevundimonas sp.]|uniref:C40 family peptidase n=1 Tax=uncultured Brevundimonas sp. TaxID=213418 RepID=UPI0025F196DD|nr:NlpC/P60 family protein [uncultured Brevundimonas sp.]